MFKGNLHYNEIFLEKLYKKYITQCVFTGKTHILYKYIKTNMEHSLTLTHWALLYEYKSYQKGVFINIIKYIYVCVCVCVCVCGHVYVVYEDTNLYNDMGMT